MIDVKKVKQALLRAFNIAEPPHPREDTLDTVLAQYFNKASHMPRELTLEAIVHLLKDGRPDADIPHHRVKEILEQYH